MYRYVGAFLCLAALGNPAFSFAGTDPIVVHGQEFENTTAFYQSNFFQENGLRCGTRMEGLVDKTSAFNPNDCALNSTNPLPEYDAGYVYTVDVVVHIITSFAQTLGNVSDSLIYSQIDVLNEDFRALAGTPGELGADVGVEFRLAPFDPNGNPTTGITRTAKSTYYLETEAYYDSLAWDPSRYMNLYSTSAGGNLGYVPFLPQQGGVGTNADRVVCYWEAMGRPGVGGPPYDQGRTVTHEVGHYLGLWHTFSNGCGVATAPDCYTTGDRICDTERESTSHFGCPNTTSCTDPDPLDNYMNYTDDTCMMRFTSEQANRMRCTLENYRFGLIEAATNVADATRPVPADGSRMLRANRPNPFNPTTEIAFSLPDAGSATLRIVDVTGRLVQTLVDGDLAAGSHLYTWHGTNGQGDEVASGVYLYQLITNDGTETKRMVLTR